MVPPPQSELDQLYALARSGFIHDLLDQTKRLERSNGQYIRFAQQLRQLAETFQVKKMQRFIQQYLEER